jgi:hypothetical protein
MRQALPIKQGRTCRIPLLEDSARTSAGGLPRVLQSSRTGAYASDEESDTASVSRRSCGQQSLQARVYSPGGGRVFAK